MMLRWKSEGVKGQISAAKRPFARATEHVGDLKNASNRVLYVQFMTKKFDVVKIKLFQLIEALKAHHRSQMELGKSRIDVAEKIASLAIDSPLSEYAGVISIREYEDDTKLSCLNNYLEIHRKLRKKQQKRSDTFGDYIIKYASDWYNLIDSLVSSALQQTEQLRKVLEHYEVKVQRLYFDKQRTTKGGTKSDAYMLVYSKLHRNEIKLKKAQEDYAACSSMTVALIDEVTKNCWRDLFPLLVKITQFDTANANEEKLLIKNLDSVTESIVNISKNEYNLDTKTRFNQLNTFEKTYLNLYHQRNDSKSSVSENEDGNSVSVSNRSITGTNNFTIVMGSASDQPEIEIDLSVVEKDNSRSNRSFSGQPRDQNAVMPSLMDKLITYTSSQSSFHSNDDDTENLPLTLIMNNSLR